MASGVLCPSEVVCRAGGTGRTFGVLQCTTCTTAHHARPPPPQTGSGPLTPARAGPGEPAGGPRGPVLRPVSARAPGPAEAQNGGHRDGLTKMAAFADVEVLNGT